MLIQRLSSLCSRTSSTNVTISSYLHCSASLSAKRWQEKNEPDYTKEFINPVREVAGMQAVKSSEKGHIYDNKPVKVRVQQGCSYTWCGCGMAKTSPPFCDLTCQNLYMKKIMKSGPIKYIPTETKDVWFCNCKQSDHRPFCDGSHRNEEVQTHRFDGNKQLWEPRVKKQRKS